jgi:hypothetical protein
MSKVSMYAISAPVFARMLKNMSAILTKAEAQAKAKGYEATVLLNARLAPDMFSLIRQVQIATDHAKGAMARLAGQAPEPIDDVETTFSELQARLARVIRIVEGFSEAQLGNAENRQVTIKIPGSELKFDGLSYLTNYALPNFYFHLTAAYAILRHNGIELGKRDFLMS